MIMSRQKLKILLESDLKVIRLKHEFKSMTKATPGKKMRFWNNTILVGSQETLDKINKLNFE
jgi:hypothetical protein